MTDRAFPRLTGTADAGERLRLLASTHLRWDEWCMMVYIGPAAIVVHVQTWISDVVRSKLDVY